MYVNYWNKMGSLYGWSMTFSRSQIFDQFYDEVADLIGLPFVFPGMVRESAIPCCFLDNGDGTMFDDQGVKLRINGIVS